MDKQQINDFMKQALLEAAENSGIDVPVAALIVKNGEVIARACNRRERDRDPLAHAELLAIRAAAGKLNAWRLSGTAIFVTLEPCPMCAEAIMQSRIDTLVFSAFDPNSGACGSRFNLMLDREALPEPQVISGILEEEGSLLLKEFFRRRRKEKKQDLSE